MATRVVDNNGNPLQSYEEWAAENKRYTVEDFERWAATRPSTEATIQANPIPDEESHIEPYMYYIGSGIVGFIFGILLTVILYQKKITTIKKQAQAKVDESRCALDRVVLMMSNQNYK